MMGGAVSTGEDNDDLIDNLVEADYIKTPSVERLFRSIDRADYFTEEHRDSAYKDLAWKEGNLHISAPCIYSEVMERLKLSPGLSFLNLGSGTGYFSTMAGLALGLNGVNHGVEIHSEVVEYAKKRLESFTQLSYAIDQYEFCQPEYIVGNCLCLPPDTRRYDRIYCGAGCPENQENYFKSLLKVGGILVMPVNDQLLQITRVTETKWDTKVVLSVTFATMVCPTKKDGHLLLPLIQPPSLQNICRSVIRSLFRESIETDNPLLKNSTHCGIRRKPKKRPTTKMNFPLITMPRVDDSDEDEDDDDDIEEDEDRKSSSSSNVSEVDDEGPSRLGDFVPVEVARALNRGRSKAQRNAFKRVLRFVQTPGLFCPEEPSATTTDEPETETVEEESDAPKSKRETADSGLGDDLLDKVPMDTTSSKENLDSDSDYGEEPTDFDRDSKEDSSGREEVKMDSEDEPPLLYRCSFTKLRKKPKCSSNCKKIVYDDEEESSATSDDSKPKIGKAYSEKMMEKIQMLPLPPSVLSYLNYYRSFK